MKKFTKIWYIRSREYLLHDTHGEWRQPVLSITILGTTAVFAMTMVSLLIARMANDNFFALRTLPYVIAATVLGGCLYLFDRKRPTNLNSILLVALQIALGASFMYKVGAGAAAAFLFSVAVIVGSSLYGIWFGVWPTLASTIILGIFRAAELNGSVHPTYIYIPAPTNYSSVIAISIILHILLIACSGVHRFMTRANQRLQTAEAEKLQQLYRFAQIGEISVALIHDMANSLSSLSLEVENLSKNHKKPSVTQIRKKVKQLNKALNIARKQINGDGSAERFNLSKETTQVVESLQLLAAKVHVTLDWNYKPVRLSYTGERMLFQQLMTILVKNAIDSYPKASKPRATKRKVVVRIASKDGQAIIRITDWGRGIKPEVRKHIFEPFYSTKKDGMGIGLYLTKRFIEDSFDGTVTLQSENKQTEFIVTLPLKKS